MMTFNDGNFTLSNFTLIHTHDQHLSKKRYFPYPKRSSGEKEANFPCNERYLLSPLCNILQKKTIERCMTAEIIPKINMIIFLFCHGDSRISDRLFLLCQRISISVSAIMIILTDLLA